MYVPEESRLDISFTSDGLRVDFDNYMNGSGVAFQFSPALDVREFVRLELSGTSTQTFTFLVEYKVLEDNELRVVTSSSPQSFHSTSETQAVKIPMQYDGWVNEIVINFPIVGESAVLTIESIRLK